MTNSPVADVLPGVLEGIDREFTAGRRQRTTVPKVAAFTRPRLLNVVIIAKELTVCRSCRSSFHREYRLCRLCGTSLPRVWGVCTAGSLQNYPGITMMPILCALLAIGHRHRQQEQHLQEIDPMKMMRLLAGAAVVIAATGTAFLKPARKRPESLQRQGG